VAQELARPPVATNIVFEFEGLDKYRRRLMSLRDNKHRIELHYLDILSEAALDMIKQVAPRDTGEYALSWQVTKRGSNFVEIDTPFQALYYWLEYGTKQHEIRAVNAKVLALPFGFRERVMHTGTAPQPHMRYVIDGLQNMMVDVMEEQMGKNWKIFDHMRGSNTRMKGMPKVSNIHKTVGLTGTTVSSRRSRGRATLTRMRTGRLANRVRIGRRRTTGKNVRTMAVKAKLIDG
tara:strand:+ start:578 stop:1279 length:702 start_codon:yes stop_codon:yes gene_type:complete